MRQSLDSSLKDFFLRGGIPVTKTLMVSAVVTMLVWVLGGEAGFRLLDHLVFNWQTIMVQPWSAVTYPLVSLCGPLCTLFAVIWVWFVGGSLERSWGSKGFALFFAWVSVLTAAGSALGSMLAGKATPLANLWVPLAPLTVAWGTINPEAQVLFYFIIPLKAKYLALITAAFLYIYEGALRIHPLYGLFVLLGCAVAYYQVSQPRTYRPPRQDIRVHRWNLRRWNLIERLRDRQRRRRLEKLFRDSGYDDRGL